MWSARLYPTSRSDAIVIPPAIKLAEDEFRTGKLVAHEFQKEYIAVADASEKDTKEALLRRLAQSLLSRPFDDGYFVVRREQDAYNMFPGTYAYFSSYNDFKQWFNSLDEPFRLLHEMIFERAQKPRYDIDAKQTDIDNACATDSRLSRSTDKRAYIFTTIVDAIKAVFAEAEQELADEHLVVCDSSNAEKYSRHVIVRGFHFSCAKEASFFCRKIYSHLSAKTPEVARFFDADAGGRKFGTFRLPLCHKFGADDRVKRIISNHTFDDAIIQNISPDSIALPDVAPDSYTTRDFTASSWLEQKAIQLVQMRFGSQYDLDPRSCGSLYIFDRLQYGMRCELCDVVHHSSGLMVFLSGNMLKARCVTAKLHNGRTVDLDKIAVKRFLLMADSEATTGTVMCERDGCPPIPQSTRCEFAELPDPDFGDSDTLLIRSGVGTGKTKALQRYIDNNDLERVIIISFRRSFTDEMVGKCKGFADYRTCEKEIYLSKEKRLVIQFESLHRIDFREAKWPALLVLDESESIISQIENPVLLRNGRLSKCFRMLKALLDYSQKVIMMDAFLGQRTIELATRTRRAIRSIDNRFPAGQDKHFIVLDKTTMTCNISSMISNGKKIVVCSNTKRYIDAIFESVCTSFPDKHFKKYTGDSTKEERAELLDVNNAWMGLDGLFYTSAIMAGCSFEQKHYDHLFAIFSDSSADYRSCMQMMGRVRDIASRVYWISFPDETVEHDCSESFEDLERYVEGKYKRYASLFDEYVREVESETLKMFDGMTTDTLHTEINRNGTVTVLSKDLYYYTHLFNTLERIKSHNCFVRRLIDLIKWQGSTIEVVMDEYLNPEQKMRVEDEMNASMKIVKDEYCERVATAADITDDDYRELQRNSREWTQEEIDQSRKKALSLYYNVPESKVSSEFVRRFDPSYIRRAYKNISATTTRETINESLLNIKRGVTAEHVEALNSRKSILQATVRDGWQLHYIACRFIKYAGFQFLQRRHWGEVTEVIHRDQVTANLHAQLPAFIEEVREDMVRMLDIRRSRLQNIEQWDLKRMLAMINGVLQKVYGIGIHASGQNRRDREWLVLRLSDMFEWRECRYYPITPKCNNASESNFDVCTTLEVVSTM